MINQYPEKYREFYVFPTILNNCIKQILGIRPLKPIPRINRDDT